MAKKRVLREVVPFLISYHKWSHSTLLVIGWSLRYVCRTPKADSVSLLEAIKQPTRKMKWCFWVYLLKYLPASSLEPEALHFHSSLLKRLILLVEFTLPFWKHSFPHSYRTFASLRFFSFSVCYPPQNLVGVQWEPFGCLIQVIFTIVANNNCQLELSSVAFPEPDPFEGRIEAAAAVAIVKFLGSRSFACACARWHYLLSACAQEEL